MGTAERVRLLERICGLAVLYRPRLESYMLLGRYQGYKGEKRRAYIFVFDGGKSSTDLCPTRVLTLFLYNKTYNFFGAGHYC